MGRYLDGWLAIKKIKNKNNKELGNKNSYYFFSVLLDYIVFFFYPRCWKQRVDSNIYYMAKLFNIVKKKYIILNIIRIYI